MQKSGLKIYTHAAAPELIVEPAKSNRIQLKWLKRPPKAAKANVEQPRPKPAAKPKPAVGIHSAQRKMRQSLSVTDKLLRNSAIACALLLTVLALQNVNQPWTQNATAQLKQVLTMRIDLDESLGRLNFVRGLVPDTALVFWNMGSGDRLDLPVQGTIAHAYSAMQPWVEFVCKPQQSVIAADKGTVVAVMQGSAGDWTLLIDHENGEQTVYAYMAQALVKPGDLVEKGGQIGVTKDEEASRLYFELRKDGQPQDPALRE